MKILIIEDDELIAKVYSGKYQAAGFVTTSAGDGVRGLELVSEFKPDLIHLDLSIPKLNGVEVIKQVRSRPALKSLPIVVLSNTYQNRLVKQAIDAGATRCVSKATCTPKMMLEIVEAYRPAEASLPASPVAESAAQGAAPVSAPLDSPYTTEIHKHAAFQADIQRGFLRRAPQKLGAIRTLVAPLFKADAATRSQDLAELFRVTNSFAGQAGIAGFERLSQLASALAALVRDLMDEPKSLSPSAIHTIVAASDSLSALLDHATDPEAEPTTPGIVLVVDDDPIARRAVCVALARLSVPTLSVADPKAALSLLAENRFRLVFMDIEMPGLSGPDLCGELRKLPGYATTPVVFVSGRADDEARARGQASGASELIAKPFLPLELAVKTLTLLS